MGMEVRVGWRDEVWGLEELGVGVGVRRVGMRQSTRFLEGVLGGGMALCLNKGL